jgi:DNA polymerase elongation subunit (family B)
MASFPRRVALDAPSLDEATEPLEFQVIDWFVPENDRSKQRRDRLAGYPRSDVPRSPAEYEIFMFGATADGYSITAKVKGFQPYFFVKVPQDWTQSDADALQEKLLSDRVEMTKANGDTYMATVVRYTLRDHLVGFTIENYQDLWGFTNFTKFKFMRVQVKSLRLFNDLKRYFATKPKLYKLYESNIDPFLRFIHDRNIQPCGWVSISPDSYSIMDPDAESSDEEDPEADLPPWQRKTPMKVDTMKCAARTNYCIEVDYEQVNGLAYNKIAPLLVASFDIECTSSHGDFPVSIKNYRKLTVDLIALSRTTTLTNDMLCDIIPKAFFEPEPVAAAVNRLYAKREKHLNINDIRAKVAEIASEIIVKLKSCIKTKPKTSAAEADADAEADCSDDEDNVPVNAASASAAEIELTTLLSKHLPALAGDPIIQIGTTVHRYGSDEIIYRHIATYKSCAAIADAEVEAKKKESECIMAWKDFITRLDPDILTGYNIFGFDAKYIAERAKELGIYDELVYGLGRLKNRHCDLEERNLSSSALGDNVMYCFDLDGVVQIDMLKVMQRDHKLDSFKLDAVAGKFITESAKVGISPDTLIVGKASGLKEGNYIRINDTDKNQVVEMDADAGTIKLAHAVPPQFAEPDMKVKWALVKDDISPNEIFAKFGGNSRDRMEIAKYCLQDCALVNRLLHKLKVLENNICMGNVCYVPLSYLFMRGQGIKIFSLFSRECKLKEHLIPVIRSALTDNDDIGYEGAIVLPPQEGMYLDEPITVFDYESLYPSSMIARNISHDALVLDPEYKKNAAPGVTFHDITFDEYEGKGDAKKKIGEKTCTFAQFQGESKGIIPSILQMLLRERKNTRKKIEYKTVLLVNGTEHTGLVTEDIANDEIKITDVDTGTFSCFKMTNVQSQRDTFNEFEKAVLDARQLAYKITANSLYGQTGSKTSPIFLLEVAACTTATGREMIMLAKNFMETNYNAEVIYGDSVAGYTPIFIRTCSFIDIVTIEELGLTWIPCSGGKEACELPEGYETWTEQGWTPLHRIIRHTLAPHKRMVRIATSAGIVDVTDDHSLLTPDGEPITPKTVTVSTQLMHTSMPKIPYSVMLTHKHLIDMVQSKETVMTYESTDQLYIAYIYWVATVCDWHATLTSTSTGYTIVVNKQKPFDGSNSQSITSMEDITDQFNREHKYVYDLTTTNHHFAAGIGRIVVHNTDSIFCKFPNEGKKGREALPLAIQTGQRAAKAIKPLLPPPQSLAYEKTLWPFILFSKKRYVGNLYEDDPNKKPKQKSMGIVLKRRDNAPIVKRVYGGLIDILMTSGNLSEAVSFLKASLQDIVDGKIPIEELIISKTLKGDYKDPRMIAHKVLADRIGQRDAGNKPMVNDRIPYVYIVPPPGADVKLQGDRIEHPDYIREQGLKPDYNFYITNQLLKPISQLFALCVSQIDGYTLVPNYWEQMDIELSGAARYIDDKKRKTRLSNLKMKEVKEILFDPFIAKPLTSPKSPKKTAGAKAKAAAVASAGEGARTLNIAAVEKKRGSQYECTVTLTEADADKTVVWTFTKTYKGKKGETLRMAAIESMQRLFDAIDPKDQTKPSVLITCADKAFIKTWKSAIIAADSTDPMQAVRDNLDTELLHQLREMNALTGLVHARQVIKYILV